MLANGKEDQVRANRLSFQETIGEAAMNAVAELTGAQAGVAAAVNGDVVPRRSWARTLLRDGDQVEVVTAVQGGLS